MSETLHTLVRINGTGNAWPVFIGQEHPAYPGVSHMNNASYSIFGCEEKNDPYSSLLWSVLIDAGHGAVQNIIRHENQIPDAVVLTHGHLDHTLGLDWVAQSYFRYKNPGQPYPVYCSPGVADFVLKTYPQLEEIVNFKLLHPGKINSIDETGGLRVTAFPVYHGSSAFGASMLVFEKESGDGASKALFTGDLLCPMLRNRDYQYINDVVLTFTDCNNRFAYPNSNHWSLTVHPMKQTELIDHWRKNLKISKLLQTQLKDAGEAGFEYFDEFITDVDILDIPVTVRDFSRFMPHTAVGLVHYSGNEDQKHYNELKLNKEELQRYAQDIFKLFELKNNIIVPNLDDIYEWK